MLSIIVGLYEVKNNMKKAKAVIVVKLAAFLYMESIYAETIRYHNPLIDPQPFKHYVMQK